MRKSTKFAAASWISSRDDSRMRAGSARHDWLAAPAAAIIAHGLRMAVSLIVIKFMALALGPAGLGLLGNFMSIVTVMTLFAGGGILTGITKYVAEYRAEPERLKHFLQSASAYGLIASVVVMLITVIAAKPLSLWLFERSDLAWLVPSIGLTHLLCFIGGGIVAIVNGKHQPRLFATITIAGYVGAIPVALVLIGAGGVSGAAVALMAVAASTALPALVIAAREGLLRLVMPRIDWDDFVRLLRFTCIAAVSAIAFPVTEILIRNELTDALGLGATGIWQGLARLSGAIIGFFTMFLATSHMPRLSAISDRREAAMAVLRMLSFVGPAFAACAVLTYLGRSVAVPLLFSQAFRPMEVVIGWQLLGDLFRVCSYVVGFLGIAKAAMKIHIAAELTQCGLYLATTVVALNLGWGLRGVAQAYAVAYALYFAITLVALREYARR